MKRLCIYELKSFSPFFSLQHQTTTLDYIRQSSSLSPLNLLLHCQGIKWKVLKREDYSDRVLSTPRSFIHKWIGRN
jgi:hypothetical protein